MSTTLGIWYDKYIGKLIPKYAFFSVIFCFVLNQLVYTGAQIIMADAVHYDLSLEFDKRVPFRPEWVLVYIICFAFWIVNYILITREGKEEWFKFAVGDYLSRLICGIFFFLTPTTNVRPEVVGDGIIETLMRFIYSMDAPTNLFPSIHCLVSWMCFIGIRRSKKVPFWYKVFSCVFAILVFISTQYTKQHYILDVFAGVLIAEWCYSLGHRKEWYKKVWNIFDKINGKVFGKAAFDENI